MKKFLFISGTILFSLYLSAQKNNIKKEKWHWDSPLLQDTSAGYVQVVKAGNILYISGAASR
jgi:enamine deaminase RidA (YjgF/YER057c/UK114 family)